MALGIIEVGVLSSWFCHLAACILYELVVWNHCDMALNYLQRSSFSQIQKHALRCFSGSTFSPVERQGNLICSLTNMLAPSRSRLRNLVQNHLFGFWRSARKGHSPAVRSSHHCSLGEQSLVTSLPIPSYLTTTERPSP